MSKLVIILLFISLFFPSITIAQSSVTTLGPWTESSSLPNQNHETAPLPSFAVNKRYYVHTFSDGDQARVLYVADQQADGSLGPWRVASENHGGGPHGYTALTVAGAPYHFRNGHIARYEIDSNGNVNDIVVLEQPVSTAFDTNRYVWDTAIYVPFDQRKFIFHLGGFDLQRYGYTNDIYRIELPLNTGAKFTKIGNSPITQKPYKAAFYKVDSDMGFIYLGEKDSGNVYKAGVDKDGNLGSWTQVATAPFAGNNLGDMFVIDNQLFIIRGSKVYQALIATDGTLGSWIDSPPDLPTNQINPRWGDGHPEGKNFAIIGDYVYLTGTDKVYYTQILRPGSSPTPNNTPTTLPSPSTTTNVTPTTNPSTKPGDADGNNQVNLLDFNILKDQFGRIVANLSADFNKDGKVNLLDFEILRINFNK